MICHSLQDRFSFRCQFVLIAIAVLLLLSSHCTAKDWPMRGGSPGRNPVVVDHDFQIDWVISKKRQEIDVEKSSRWSAELGHVSCGEPVIANGLVWVGTNNGHPRDANKTEDASVLMCFRESDGKFLYQYVSPRRLAPGYHADWPGTSLASSPLIEGDRLWFCTNRCEVVCLDISPLLKQSGEPVVLWKYDMISELGVYTRSLMIGSHASHCSVAGYKEFIYVNTTNSRSYTEIPAPDAPSLICLQKADGKLRWQDNSPGANIIDVQHGSPIVIEVEGKAQVVMGQGDGWVRSFDALTGKLIWKFDMNPKAILRHRYQGNSTHMVATPVFHNQRIYVAGGRERELGATQGRLYCLNPTKQGDISEELLSTDGEILPNANSGIVWKYLGHGDKEKDEEIMHSTLSNVAVHKGFVIACDSHGMVHSLDEQTGEWLWSHDCFSTVIGSPLIVGDKVYITDEDGDLLILELARELKVMQEVLLSSSVETAPVFANETLFITTRDQLIAID